MGTAEKNVSQPSQGQCIAPEKAISGRTRRSISWVSAREIMVSALLMLCAMFPSWGLNCSGAKQIHGELLVVQKRGTTKLSKLLRQLLQLRMDKRALIGYYLPVGMRFSWLAT